MNDMNLYIYIYIHEYHEPLYDAHCTSLHNIVCILYIHAYVCMYLYEAALALKQVLDD